MKLLSDEDIDALDGGMCGEREFYREFARRVEQAVIRNQKVKPDHVEQFTRMAHSRKEPDAFQALIDKGQPL